MDWLTSTWTGGGLFDGLPLWQGALIMAVIWIGWGLIEGYLDR